MYPGKQQVMIHIPRTCHSCWRPTVLGPWFWHSPGLAVTGLWDLNQWMEGQCVSLPASTPSLPIPLALSFSLYVFLVIYAMLGLAVLIFELILFFPHFA